MKYVESVLDLIGNTPMYRSEYLSQNGCDVFLKLDYFNPGGSIKDRAALSMIEHAEKAGLVREGSHIIEASSGNMAIGLAMVCAAKGYALTLVMQDNVSPARQKLLSAYGARLVLTPKELGLVGAMTEAESIALETKHAFVPRQFENVDNAEVHFKTTGPEIWTQLDGKVDVFVCSVGSAGTITGISRYIKQQNPDVKVVAVEPEESAVISKEKARAHQFAGMGANFVPSLLDESVIDDVVKVSLAKAVSDARELAKREMLLLGIASSAMVHATLACTKRYPNSRIVTIASAHGERYAGSYLYDIAGKGAYLSFAQEI